MKRSIKIAHWLIFGLVLVNSRLAFSQVRLPRLIGDNMVLQRDTKVTIWGWAAVGEKVNVLFNGKTYTTTAGADSTWHMILPAMKAGGPFDMDIQAGNHITVKNILIGDVWVCSGQSNMELPMERVKEKYPDVIAQANNPNIRQFNVSTRYNFQSPQNNLETGNWQPATTESVLQFTAVGYFFAKALYEKYHVPIGLIKASVGGSPAEAWLPKEALQAFPPYLEMVLRFANNSYIDSIRNNDNLVRNTWYNNIWKQDKGLHDSLPWFDT